MDIHISVIICDCGQIMEQDDEAAWTCFNEKCKDKGRTFFPVIKLVEVSKEKIS